MYRSNSLTAALVAGLLGSAAWAQAPAPAQPPAAARPAQTLPAPAATPAPAVPAPATPVAAAAVREVPAGSLTVQKITELQRERELARLEKEVNQAKGRGVPAAAPGAASSGIESGCHVDGYQLLSVYGTGEQLNADVALCGSAILRVTVGDHVGEGWKVAQIQTSHLTISKGKGLKQVWMPARKDTIPTGVKTPVGLPQLPMSLPPLPQNLAPTPATLIQQKKDGDGEPG